MSDYLRYQLGTCQFPEGIGTGAQKVTLLKDTATDDVPLSTRHIGTFDGDVGIHRKGVVGKVGFAVTPVFISFPRQGRRLERKVMKL